MREAFTYMFKDNCFYKKASVYTLLSFLAFTFLALADISSYSGGCNISQGPCILSAIKPEVLAYRIIGLFFYILIMGYYLTNLEAVLKQEKNIVLPFFNFKTCFNKGLKLIFSIFITATFLYVLVSGYVILGFITPQINLLTFLPVIVAIPTILYMVCYNSFMYEYVVKNKIFTFFNIKNAILNIKKAPKNYFKNWAVLVLIFILSAVIIYLLELLYGLFDNLYVTMIVTNITSAIISTYVEYTSMYLIKKSV